MDPRPDPMGRKEMAESVGVEPGRERLPVFETGARTIPGRTLQGRKVLESNQPGANANGLANRRDTTPRNLPQNGPSWIRTKPMASFELASSTAGIKALVWCPSRDSNPEPSRSKRAASTSWARRAIWWVREEFAPLQPETGDLQSLGLTHAQPTQKQKTPVFWTRAQQTHFAPWS